MLRISKLTDYATVVLTQLSRENGAVVSAQMLAERTRVEPSTTAKVLKMLASEGLVNSTRGANGGYCLSRPATEITIAQIIRAMEGPIGMTECAVNQGLCTHERFCDVRGNWRRISAAVEDVLSQMSLAEMAAPSERQCASDGGSDTDASDQALSNTKRPRNTPIQVVS